MNENLFLKDNNLILKCGEKLYLNSARADVNFVVAIDDDHSETIPAHKLILSTGSPVFEAMFYGSIKEDGDVKIVDTSPDAFKEFLQFFYLDKFRLTSGNVIEVTKLCHKYEVDDSLTLCEIALKRMLTTDSTCSGYALALLLGLESTIKFCELQIKQNSKKMLKSNDFLACDWKTMDKILELVSSKCDPLTIVESSMAWAKAECERNGLEDTPANLRAQLNDLFHRIPFADLNKEQFSQHVSGYKRFFTEDDLELIIEQTMSKKAKTTASVKMNFDFEYFRLAYEFPSPILCTFVANDRLCLKEICFSQTIHPNVKAAITLRTLRSEQPYPLGNVNLGPIRSQLVLSVPVVIDPNEKYFLKIDWGPLRSVIANCSKKNFAIQEDIEIQFTPNTGIITGLLFERFPA